jgi:hypothetical protein
MLQLSLKCDRRTGDNHAYLYLSFNHVLASISKLSVGGTSHPLASYVWFLISV